MDPEIALRTGPPAVTDDLERCLIALAVCAPDLELPHMPRNDGQHLKAETVDPVRHGLAGEHDAAPGEIGLHPVRGHALDDLLVHDLRGQ